jgi:hypothetical protein
MGSMSIGEHALSFVKLDVELINFKRVQKIDCSTGRQT